MSQGRLHLSVQVTSDLKVLNKLLYQTACTFMKNNKQSYQNKKRDSMVSYLQNAPHNTMV